MVQKGKLYYSISEVAGILGVAPSLIRFWEKHFKSVNPYRNKKGNRFYTNSDILELKKIYHLVKEKGYTLKGAAEMIAGSDNHANDVRAELLKTLEHVREQLTLLRDGLKSGQQGAQ